MNQIYARVDLGAIKSNLHAISEKVGRGVKVMPCIKADAYGHGMIMVAKVCMEENAYGVCVATIDEGVELRKAGFSAPILVLTTMLAEIVPVSVEYDLIQTVTAREHIEAMNIAAIILNKKAMVHINYETGINRAGVGRQDLTGLLSLIKNCSNVELHGFYTHFAKSDAVDKSYSNMQISEFEKAMETVKSFGFDPLFHASNSGAVHDLRASYDLIRPGISIYGVYPSMNVKRDIELQPAMQWKTHIVRVKEIDAGESVSYNCTWTSCRKTRIAVLPVGYGDGYKRNMSAKASVLIRGKRVQVIGLICMDQCMVDVTDIEAEVGDEVTLLGTSGSECISAEEMASWADTINYEILLSISKRVPRIYE